MQPTNNSEQQEKNNYENIYSKSPQPNTHKCANQEANFSHFFDKEEVEKNHTDLEIFNLNIEKEISEFNSIISHKNFKIIQNINSTSKFWRENVNKFPLLSLLARALAVIKSSGACIERYFSICGFSNKKRSSAAGKDLFISRCILRANIDILKDMNQISF